MYKLLILKFRLEITLNLERESNVMYLLQRVFKANQAGQYIPVQFAQNKKKT